MERCHGETAPTDGGSLLNGQRGGRESPVGPRRDMFLLRGPGAIELDRPIDMLSYDAFDILRSKFRSRMPSFHRSCMSSAMTSMIGTQGDAQGA